MRVKVCGMTQLDQVRKLEEMGIDFAGLIFYPKSPRYAGKNISGEQLRRAKLRIGKVGVFVNTPYEQMMRTVDEYGLDMVQLHGDETPRACEQIANYVTVIKVFRLGENDPISWIIKSYEESCDMFLFDTLGVGYGGTGKKFNWDVLKPEDTDKLNSFFNEEVAKKLFSIDINSRFEIQSGVKDLDKIKTFYESLKAK
jgi:phosphoribosylanthranilate isomerase